LRSVWGADSAEGQRALQRAGASAQDSGCREPGARTGPSRSPGCSSRR